MDKVRLGKMKIFHRKSSKKARNSNEDHEVHRGSEEELKGIKESGVSQRDEVLAQVSWTCPTLNRRRDQILSYFESLIAEPIYEEIPIKTKRAPLTSLTTTQDETNKEMNHDPKNDPKTDPNNEAIRIKINGSNYSNDSQSNGGDVNGSEIEQEGWKLEEEECLYENLPIPIPLRKSAFVSIVPTVSISTAEVEQCNGKNIQKTDGIDETHAEEEEKEELSSEEERRTAEIERRRIIGSQRVKSKLISTWIKGEVILDSIIENKAATKSYWETKMKEANTSSNKAKRVEGLQQQWAYVKKPMMEKINNEIEELHMREVELGKQGGSSSGTGDSDFESVSEYDSFDFQPSRLSSQTPDSTRSFTPADTADSNETRASPDSRDSGGFSVHEDEVISPQPTPTPENEKEEIETQKVVFNTAETPIEREIRLAQEREEEFRREKFGTVLIQKKEKSPAKEVKEKSPKRELTTEVKVGGKEGGKIEEFEASKIPFEVKNVESVEAEEVAVRDEKKRKEGSSKVPGRNTQYQMATARLKKEIEEALMREAELQRGRSSSKSPDLLAEPKPPLVTFESDYLNEEEEEKPKRESSKPPLQTTKDETTPSKAGVEAEGTKEPNPPVHTSLKLKIVAVDLRNEKAEPSPVLNNSNNGSPTNATTSPTVFLLGKGKKFNSMERFLLKSSSKLVIGNRFEIPPPVVEVPPEPKKEEEPKESEGEEEVKPKRKYISAQHKIEKELREMVLREKELSQLRLTIRQNSQDLSIEEEIPTPEPVAVAAVAVEEPTVPTPEETTTKEENEILLPNTIDYMKEDEEEIPSQPNGRDVPRRRSALISKWEQMIAKEQNV